MAYQKFLIENRAKSANSALKIWCYQLRIHLRCQLCWIYESGLIRLNNWEVQTKSRELDAKNKFYHTRYSRRCFASASDGLCKAQDWCNSRALLSHFDGSLVANPLRCGQLTKLVVLFDGWNHLLEHQFSIFCNQYLCWIWFVGSCGKRLSFIHNLSSNNGVFFLEMRKVKGSILKERDFFLFEKWFDSVIINVVLCLFINTKWTQNVILKGNGLVTTMKMMNSK